MKTKWYKNAYNWFLIVITTLVILPILAPVLMNLGIKEPAKVIYFVYSFTCHQFHHRSLHIGDYQLAWCARDTAIWGSVAGVAWINKFVKMPPIKFYWLLPFVIPIALDGGIQTIASVLNLNNDKTLGDCPMCAAESIILPIYTSSNPIRFLTGAIFGTGLSMWISPTLRMQSDEMLKNIKNNLTLRKFIDVTRYPIFTKDVFKHIAVAIIVPIIAFFGYLANVQIWNVTADKFKPEGGADFIVRTPKEDFFARRLNAVCPTGGLEDIDYKNPANNFLALDCFFGKEK